MRKKEGITRGAFKTCQMYKMELLQSSGYVTRNFHVIHIMILIMEATND